MDVTTLDDESLRLELTRAHIDETNARRVYEEALVPLKEALARRDELTAELRRRTWSSRTPESITVEDLRPLVEAAWSHGSGDLVASELLESWIRHFHPSLSRAGYEPTEDCAGPTYVTPRVSVTRTEDVESLAAALLALTSMLAADRGSETVTVDVMEHTLSEDGSYSIQVDPSAGTAVLSVLSWGRRREVTSGTLRDVLLTIQRDHYIEY